MLHILNLDDCQLCLRNPPRIAMAVLSITIQWVSKWSSDGLSAFSFSRYPFAAAWWRPCGPPASGPVVKHLPCREAGRRIRKYLKSWAWGSSCLQGFTLLPGCKANRCFARILIGNAAKLSGSWRFLAPDQMPYETEWAVDGGNDTMAR